MNPERLYIEETGDVAPKPSVIRRSGKLAYARKARVRRHGLNPPSGKRLIDQQQVNPMQIRGRYVKAPNPSPAPLPKVEPKDDGAVGWPANEDKAKTAEVGGRATESVLNKTAETVDTETDDAPADPSDAQEASIEPPNAQEELTEPPNVPRAILDDKMFGFEHNLASSDPAEHQASAAISEVSAESSFISNFTDIQEDNGGNEQDKTNNDKSSGISPIDEKVSSASEKSKELSSKVPMVPEQRKARARVYTRPHTNQTVVVGSDTNDDNDSKSTASGLSHPSWVSRRMRRAEEERDELSQISQTSVGNKKRRARIKNAKSRFGSDDSRNGNIMGYVVSHAFDKMLGYAGGTQHEADDGYYSEESENILGDLQDALMSTFGCSVPHHGKRTKSKDDDDMTVGTNNTGGQSKQSNHSEVQHVRSVSELSGWGSTISGSSAGPILSFDMTEELADFSKDKKPSSTPSYKVPDTYDPNPPKLLEPIISAEGSDAIASQSSKPMYSKDLYSNIIEPDFEPVNLLEDGDNLLDSMGKDLLGVANSTLSSIGSLLGGIGQDAKSAQGTAETSAITTAESSTLMSSLSNVAEPLEVITENDAEGNPASPAREKPIENAILDTTDDDFKTFEDQFEINVFESLESNTSAEVVETDTPAAASNEEIPSADQEIMLTESLVSLFQGIEDTENPSQPEDPLQREDVKVEFEAKFEAIEDDQVESNSVVRKDGMDLSDAADPKTEEDPSSSPIEKQGTEDSSSEKVATNSITLDRGESSSPVLSLSEKRSRSENIKSAAPAFTEALNVSVPVSSDVIASQSKSSEAESPSITAKKESKTSFQAALKAPQTKKPKNKKFFKGLFRRSSKKNKKQNPLASSLGELSLKNYPEVDAPVSQSARDKIIEISSPHGAQSTVSPKLGTSADPNGPEHGTWMDFRNDETKAGTIMNAPRSCPTTPVHEPEGAMDTPKMSNLRLEERKLTRPISGTDLADLPGIDEANSFREDPPAGRGNGANQKLDPIPQPETNNDGFNFSPEVIHGFEKPKTETVKSFEEDKNIPFEEFNMNNIDFDLTPTQHKWESFGDNTEDVGAAAYRQKAFENAKIGSPQKVSSFPGMSEF